MSSMVPYDRLARGLRTWPFESFDDFFGAPLAQLSNEGSFKMDVEDAGDKYVVSAELPGVKREEIDVELNEGPEIRTFLKGVWDAMRQEVRDGLTAEGVLPGGLNVQRKAKYLLERTHQVDIPQVRELQQVCAYAFAAAEQNADNGTIVTAPTCGSCGVLPAVLVYLQDKYKFSDDKIAEALSVAGLFGCLIKRNASVSGAECGCQAEIGSACSMAAAAMSQLMGLSIQEIEYSAEIAMEHHLGLTCDPICGLVQIPCIERNAVAAKRAIDASNLAHMLVGTRTISFDMVVRTMYETGRSINKAFRETSEGGLAKLYSRRAPIGS